jgi:acyl carrier protein
MTDSPDPTLLDQIKSILRRDLKLGPAADIPDDMPLVGGDMDLDSLDILLLVSSLEKQFSIKIPSEAVGRWVFTDVSTLAKYVQDNRETLKVAAAPQQATAVDYLSRLPHGPGFRFVSRVDQVVPGTSASGVWEIKGDEAFFADHFPNNPVVPGVLLVEAMAQLAGFCSAGEAKGGMIAHVDVRFEAPVRPPATIELSAAVSQSAGALLRCDVSATVAGQVVARGAITLHLA